MHKAIITILALALAGCATQPPLLKQTSSGMPEGKFRNNSVADVRNTLIARCASAGMTVHDSSPNQVTCGKTLTGGDAALSQALIGNAYSSTPERKVRFTFYQAGADVSVVASQWLETQMALGQTRRVDLDTNTHKNDLQQVLFSFGAE